MSKNKPRKPNPYVEYTFFFPNNCKRYTLRYVHENEKGLLIFYNLTTKQYAKPMTLRHFDWILQYNLIHTKKVVGPVKVVNVKLSRRDKLNFRLLKSLSKDEIKHVNSMLAYTVNELEARYKKALMDKEELDINAYRKICESIGYMIETAN